jgi:hypothetical protein
MIDGDYLNIIEISSENVTRWWLYRKNEIL